MRKVILLLLVAASQFSNAQMPELNIDSCKSIARRNYPLIRQYELIQKSAEYSISNANKAYLPQISLSGTAGYIFGGVPALGPVKSGEDENYKFIGLGQLNQALWDGGGISAQKKMISAQESVEKSGNDVQLYELDDRIEQVYFGILLINEQIGQIGIQLQILERNVSRLELLSSNGYALRTQLNELKAEVLKIRQHKTEFEFSRKSFIEMLSVFLQVPLPDSIHLIKPEIKFNPENKITRPEVSLFESKQQLINSQSSADKAKLMPKVGLLGVGLLISPGINLGMQEKSSLALAGINLSWQLGGLYTNSNNKKLREMETGKIQSQLDAFLYNTQIEKNRSSAEIDKWKALLQSDDEIISLLTSVREGYQLQFDNGTCSLYELINATDKETAAKADKAMHEIQLLSASYKLNHITGN
jgi:outer membrane protein TolC